MSTVVDSSSSIYAGLLFKIGCAIHIVFSDTPTLLGWP